MGSSIVMLGTKLWMTVTVPILFGRISRIPMQRHDVFTSWSSWSEPAFQSGLRDRMVPSAYRWIYGMVLSFDVAGERVEAELRWWAWLRLCGVVMLSASLANAILLLTMNYRPIHNYYATVNSATKYFPIYWWEYGTRRQQFARFTKKNTFLPSPCLHRR